MPTPPIAILNWTLRAVHHYYQIYQNVKLMYTIITEPGHCMSYKIACAPSEGLDQPALQSVRFPPEDALNPFATHTVPYEDSDQIARKQMMRISTGFWGTGK